MIHHSPTAVDAEYWNGLAQGELRMPRCAHCERWQWPATARCGECGHWGSSWHALPLRGRVFSWTRTWHPFDGLEALPRPFVTVLVEIDGTDGKRLLGLLEKVSDNDVVPNGAVVEGRIGSTAFGGEDVPVIVWHLVD